MLPASSSSVAAFFCRGQRDLDCGRNFRVDHELRRARCKRFCIDLVFSERSSVFRAPGLGPGGRMWKSCRSDHLSFSSSGHRAAVAESMRHPSSKRTYAGENPAGSARFYCQVVSIVARRPVKPLVLVRVQVWQPFSGGNVSSRRPCSERGGCLRTATKVQLLPP